MVLKYFGFIAVLLSAGSALADGRYTTDASPAPQFTPLQFVQNDLSALGETELRRMVFYAERALNTLTEVVLSAETQDIAAQNKINAQFRTAIVRLADAGLRSGLSSDQVADFFTQTILENAGQDMLDRTRNIGGGLDLRTLLRNVATSLVEPDGAAGNKEALHDALAAAITGLPPEESEHGTAVNTTPAQLARPVPFANATDAERAIIDRVVINGGQWEIRVAQGDSLSAIASAIYGDTLAFTTIFEANRATVSNPNVLVVDSLLVLPQP